MALTPQGFRDRFALAAFSDGGVVVDLTTGSYSRLNATAATLLSLLRDAPTEAAAVESIVARFGITAARARQDLAGLATGLEQAEARIPPIEPFEYRPAEDGGYDLWHGEHRALHVDADARRLILGRPRGELPLPVYEYVSDMAPKIMFLQGTPVLHGSSWRGENGVLGMCGKSRAGKTTTARTLARHAGALVSEDLIILTSDLAAPRIFAQAEGNVHRWEREAARALESGADGVDLAGLRTAVSGPTSPLATLWFLDARRRGERFEPSPVAKAVALTELMSHAFLGATGEDSWRRFFAAGHAIVDATTTFEVALPMGLDRLDAALATYATNSAS